MNITPVGVAVALAVVVALAFLFFGPALLTPFAPQTASGPSTATASDTSAALSTGGDAAATTTTTTSGLQIQDLRVGTGTEAMPGDTVTVEYVGALTDGTVFDSTQQHGQPFTFTLGAGQVIAGWDEGVAGMRVGGQRGLTIPPSLGYGAQANGPIPANSTLIFEIQLDDVQQGSAQ